MTYVFPIQQVPMATAVPGPHATSVHTNRWTHRQGKVQGYLYNSPIFSYEPKMGSPSTWTSHWKSGHQLIRCGIHRQILFVFVFVCVRVSSLSQCACAIPGFSCNTHMLGEELAFSIPGKASRSNSPILNVNDYKSILMQRKLQLRNFNAEFIQRSSCFYVLAVFMTCCSIIIGHFSTKRWKCRKPGATNSRMVKDSPANG